MLVWNNELFHCAAAEKGNFQEVGSNLLFLFLPALGEAVCWLLAPAPMPCLCLRWYFVARRALLHSLAALDLLLRTQLGKVIFPVSRALPAVHCI